MKASADTRLMRGAGLVLELFKIGLVLQLRTMCYIKPVLMFGTEQDMIVNSRHPRSQRSQRSVCLMSISKSATVKWYCLREFVSEVCSGNSSYRTSVVSTGLYR
jgi:hypothetical protein